MHVLKVLFILHLTYCFILQINFAICKNKVSNISFVFFSAIFVGFNELDLP